jgi:hypothetical protein
MIDASLLEERLRATGEAIVTLAGAASQLQAQWRPTPDDWSLLEVVNHLWDEEREDFRTRLDYTIHRPDDTWPPIDPAGWITSRAYNQRDLAESIAGFRAERDRSLSWLAGLGSADPEASHTSPFGTMRAGDLMASWAAHDLLHIRQLNELSYAWLARDSAPYSPDYAGEW